jgi:transposase-like protein
MTTLDGVTKKKPAEESSEQQAAAKTVLETALNEEMTEHLGYEKHDRRAWARAISATAPGPRRC